MWLTRTSNHSIFTLVRSAHISNSSPRNTSAREISSSILNKTENLEKIQATEWKPFYKRYLASLIYSNTTSFVRLKPSLVHSRQYHVLSTARLKQVNRYSLFDGSHSMISTNARNFSVNGINRNSMAEITWFKYMADSRIVEASMTGLQGLHETLHLPWWGTIVVTTVLLHSIIAFPLTVYQQYVLARMENLKPEFEERIKELMIKNEKDKEKFGWSKKKGQDMYTKSAKEMRKEIFARENLYPFTVILVPWLQFPIWVTMSMAYRNLVTMKPHEDEAAQEVFLEMTTGGFCWIQNLTEADPTLILSVAFGIINLAMSEVTGALSVHVTSRFLANIQRLTSLAIIPLSAAVPSGLVFLWVLFSLWFFLLKLALMHPGIRRICGIPYSPLTRQHPYKYLWTQIRKRCRRVMELIGLRK